MKQIKLYHEAQNQYKNLSNVEKEQLRKIFQRIDQQALAKLKTEEEIVQYFEKLSVIPIEKHQTSPPQQKEQQGNSGILHLLPTIALSLAAVYFGGPLAAVAARSIFTYGYNLYYGTPALYHPSYWLVYMPWREHVTNYAYQIGKPLFLMLAPFLGNFIKDHIKKVADYFQTPKETVAEIKIVTTSEMDDLIRKMAKLKVSLIKQAQDDEPFATENEPVISLKELTAFPSRREIPFTTKRLDQQHTRHLAAVL
jgi:hypothetical protein